MALGSAEIIDVGTEEVAGPNEATYIMESFLGVFQSYFGIHQGLCLRPVRGPPPIANVEPKVPV